VKRTPAPAGMASPQGLFGSEKSTGGIGQDIVYKVQKLDLDKKAGVIECGNPEFLVQPWVEEEIEKRLILELHALVERQVDRSVADAECRGESPRTESQV